MFYSHQLLARKGPLGTVWCAAHAQHRLKKPQYTATDIPSTVDLIMYPETPMALRMSGHLLLGVVRIYSKKVDYLHHDLNHLYTWIGKAFLTVQVDLPENARQAPVESVTLPQALNLDEFDLEDDTLEREFNNHRLSEEDITLTDQIPTGIDPYVAVTFDEDIFPESSPLDVDQFTVPVSEHTETIDVDMVHEAGPDNEPIDFNITVDVGTDSPRNLTVPVSEHTEKIDVDMVHEAEPDNKPRDSNITLDVGTDSRHNSTEEQHPSSVEKNRDAQDVSPASDPSCAAEQQSDRVERTKTSEDTSNEKKSTTPYEETSSPRRHLPSEHRSGSTVIAGSEEASGNLVNRSAPLPSLPPSPPLSPTRPRKRMRFDKVTVLTNRIMKERLENPSDTFCKRKKMPSSKVGVWRLNNQSKKDQCFNEPLFTGFSDGLRSAFEKNCVASKPYLAVSDETLPPPASVLTPTRETETEINLTSPIPQSVVPDSTNPDSTAQLSPVQQTGDVQGLSSPRPAYAESVATEEQTPQTLEHGRDGGPPEFMPTPPPRSPPSRIDDVTTQPGTEHSPSTVPEDRPGLIDDKGIEHLSVGGQPESMPSPPPRSPPSRIDDFTTQPGTEPSPSIIPEDRPGTEPSLSIIPEDRPGTEPSPSIISEDRPGTEPSPSIIPEDRPGTEPPPSIIPEDRPGTEPSPSIIQEDRPKPSDDKGIEHLRAGGHPESTAEDFFFLGMGGDTPVILPASQDSDALSGRTRALAQYLKQCSSSSPTSSHPSEDLSLNEILTGKTRQVAARMFFETLVLKSRGLIDMQQDQPYGDIALKLKPAFFSKFQT